MEEKIRFDRNRFLYLLFIIITVFAGLASRKWEFLFPDFINTYLGDALWAMMVYLGIAFIFNRKHMLIIFFYALSFCYIIEISQFYHEPWIDSIRRTKIGGLILGFGFLWTDIIAYTIGTGASLLAEYLYLIVGSRRKNKLSNML